MARTWTKYLERQLTIRSVLLRAALTSQTVRYEFYLVQFDAAGRVSRAGFRSGASFQPSVDVDPRCVAALGAYEHVDPRCIAMAAVAE